jgi:hypothetical protein
MDSSNWRLSLGLLAAGVAGLVLFSALAASLPSDSLGANLAGLAAVAAILPGLVSTFVSGSRLFRRR